MAARFGVAPWLCGLIVAGGCTWPHQRPGARNQKPEGPEPEKPSLVVQKPTADERAEPTESVDQRILDYVRNIDGVARRVNPDPSGSSGLGRQTVYTSPPHLAADAQESPIRVNPIPPPAAAEGQARVTFEPTRASRTDFAPAGSAERADGPATAPTSTMPPSPLEPPVLTKVHVRGERGSEVSDVAEPAETAAASGPMISCGSRAAALRRSCRRTADLGAGSPDFVTRHPLTSTPDRARETLTGGFRRRAVARARD